MDIADEHHLSPAVWYSYDLIILSFGYGQILIMKGDHQHFASTGVISVGATMNAKSVLAKYVVKIYTYILQIGQ